MLSRCRKSWSLLLMFCAMVELPVASATQIATDFESFPREFSGTALAFSQDEPGELRAVAFGVRQSASFQLSSIGLLGAGPKLRAVTKGRVLLTARESESRTLAQRFEATYAPDVSPAHERPPSLLDFINDKPTLDFGQNAGCCVKEIDIAQLLVFAEVAPIAQAVAASAVTGDQDIADRPSPYARSDSDRIAYAQIEQAHIAQLVQASSDASAKRGSTSSGDFRGPGLCTCGGGSCEEGNDGRLIGLITAVWRLVRNITNCLGSAY